jgi:galactofuranosylgalactofuranosylrhamnosyl-N-acetylglucosaminyl-diphospho-decaprenol beta-1,5/1,6-galactofuranosyltransferase
MSMHSTAFTGAKIQSTALMDFVFPSLGLCSEEALYFRLSSGAAYSYARREVSFDKGGAIDLGTYFNGLGIGKWRSLTTVSRVRVRIEILGAFEVRFVLNRQGRSELIVGEETVESLARGMHEFELPFWTEYNDGMLGLRLIAKGESKFFGGGFVTTDEPERQVRLGIVVTTFNRQAYVLPAIERLRQALNLKDQADRRFSCVVVDNGMNLPLQTGMGVVVIPNRNIGGSGGFMRGLIHLMDEGKATHCLFMDDDATCEMDSIRRTHSILSYAKDPDASVAGAMLLENKQAIQHERGAMYRKGRIRALGTKMNMTLMSNLLANEVEEKIDYAGWWFCAFPIASAKTLAFPFFVRGDDILFSLENLSSPIVMNGIGSWQEDFDNKQGPMIEYLSARSLLAICLIRGDVKSLRSISVSLVRHAFAISSRYNYDRAEAVCMAMEDVLSGPAFWRSNVDMAQRRKDITSVCQSERGDLAVDASGLVEYDNQPRIKVSKRMRGKLKAVLSHVIPDAFLKPDSDVRGCANDKALHDVAFRRRSYVQYVSDPKQGFRLSRDRRRYFALLSRVTRACLALRQGGPELSSKYVAAHPGMTSQEFWRSQFGV